MMKHLSQWYRYVARRAERWQRERREAYLGAATDIYDLERRLRDFTAKDRDLVTREREIGTREKKLDDAEQRVAVALEEQRRKLEAIAGLTAEEARRQLLVQRS